jgi:3-deoxy-D-manno-octulosonate 8-phosphate phosphatase (KDO 8-P phosphatase)
MPRISASLRRRAAAVRLVALDVDGVLTDGRLYYGPRGEALKAFDVRDGLGIRLLQQAGIAVAVITGRRSSIVTARARELGMAPVLQGQKDKGAALRRVLARLGHAPEACAFMGDDWPDAPAMAMAGLAASVPGAPAEVRALAHWVAPSHGGRGAVRDLAMLILEARGQRDQMWTAACHGPAGELARG